MHEAKLREVVAKHMKPWIMRAPINLVGLIVWLMLAASVFVYFSLTSPDTATGATPLWGKLLLSLTMGGIPACVFHAALDVYRASRIRAFAADYYMTKWEHERDMREMAERATRETEREVWEKEGLINHLRRLLKRKGRMTNPLPLP